MLLSMSRASAALALSHSEDLITVRTGLGSFKYFGAKWDLNEYYDEVSGWGRRGASGQFAQLALSVVGR